MHLLRISNQGLLGKKTSWSSLRQAIIWSRFFNLSGHCGESSISRRDWKKFETQREMEICIHSWQRVTFFFSLIKSTLEKVSRHCALFYQPNNSISYSEFPSFSEPSYWLSLWNGLPSVFTQLKIIHCLLFSFPSLLPFPLVLSDCFSGMKPLTGRWADGDRQCSPGRKLIGRDWESIWRGWILLTWWENQSTLPVYLHQLRDHRLMLSLLGVIKIFVSTLTSRPDKPSLQLMESSRGAIRKSHTFLMTAKCLHLYLLQIGPLAFYTNHHEK